MSLTRDSRDIVPVQERTVGPGRRGPPKREVDPKLQQLFFAARGREEEVISLLREALENGLVRSDTVQDSKECEALPEHRDFCEIEAEKSI